MDDPKFNVIAFNIGSENFKVRTDENEDKVLNAASFVEEKLSLHMPLDSAASSHKKVMLAMMEMASEMIDLKEKIAELESTQTEVDKKLSLLAESISSESNEDDY